MDSPGDTFGEKVCGLLFCVCGIVGLLWLDFRCGFTGSESDSYVPADKVIAVKEVSQGGDVGIIGTQKGPRGFMTAKSKKYEVTYEDEDGVIRTKTMSSDPTK